MNGVRRSRGFEPLGSTGAHALGLSRTRVKDLELRVAWRHVAGPALARRASVLALRRGVLELSIAEPEWRRVLENLFPELGARFARHYPGLGVTRFRLVDAPKRPA
jgi:Dna[CI] antecedent, DciA